LSGASGILFCLIFIHHRNHISDPNTLVEWCIVHAVNVGIAIACSGQNVTVRTDADFDMHRANAKFQYPEMFTPSQLITFPDRSLDSPEHFSCWTSTAHPSRLRTPSPGARRARTTHSHRTRQTSSRTTCRSRRRGRASCASRDTKWAIPLQLLKISPACSCSAIPHRKCSRPWIHQLEYQAWRSRLT